MNAQHIVDLLAQKHSKDVFVPECKDGPSQMVRGHLRMDAWAMARSWSNPYVAGYEIKVNRHDFLSDEKWQQYLDYCNRFSFVCPHGVIAPEEIPDNVGLLYVAKTGSRLFTKRKPVHRDVDIPENVYRYILMCRAEIRKSEFVSGPRKESDREYWQRWMENKKIDFDLGQRVGQALRQRITEEIIKARSANKQLQENVANYEAIREILRQMDLDPDNPPREFWFKAELQKAQEVVSQYDLRRLRTTSKTLSELADALEEINKAC